MTVRVAYDARTVDFGGVGRVALEVLRALRTVATAEQLEVVALVAVQAASTHLAARAADLRAEGPTIRTPGKPFRPVEQLSMPRELRRLRPDVLHAPHFNVPYLARTPVVLTVHDLFPLHDKRVASSALMTAYYRTLLPLAIRRAARVVAVSEATAHDLRRTLDVDERKLRVVPLGVDRTRWHPPPVERIDEVRARHGLPEHYLLIVGPPKFHKNHRTVLAALRRTDPALVLVGVTPAEVPALGPTAGRVQAIGGVADAELCALYAGARALLVPALYEAVGLPVWEAMAVGTPVLASRGGGLPDTVGDAGILVDPLDPHAWRAALDQVLGDETLATELRARGQHHVERRTWETTARGYAEIYREV